MDFTLVDDCIDRIVDTITKLKFLLEGDANQRQLDNVFRAISKRCVDYKNDAAHKNKSDIDLKRICEISILCGHAAEIFANENYKDSDFENEIVTIENMWKILSKQLKSNGIDCLDRNLILEYLYKDEKYKHNTEDELTESVAKIYDASVVEKKYEYVAKEANGVIEKIDKLNNIVNESNKAVDEFLTAAKKEADAELLKLNQKNAQADDLIGHISKKAMASDYDRNASEEKKVANWLRGGSLFCMLIIILIGAFSVYESFDNDFKIDNAIVRISLIFLVSIPAAYLARESSKHREQQYYHQQKSLDLKAITPYIASLPEEDQHKLKIEIASRLFASQNRSKEGKESYPINIQEIILALVNNLNAGKKEKASKMTDL
ncbi:hypothetical protein [Microvirgula aerodenitrificans]|uniref:hypothetical protein n=1 Tax=Microvirgula aerodenitrificans TaxID=57480 RepID=UPI0012EC53CE|nr:hypothetical protein [Microvirgula aerodenitrificans]